MECFSNFLFFNDAGVASISNALSNHGAGRTFIIEVSGTHTGLKIDIEGSVDFETPVYTALSTKDAKTGTVAAQITANGIYIIDAIGISSIRANLVQITTGEVKVFGKLMSY